MGLKDTYNLSYTHVLSSFNKKQRNKQKTEKLSASPTSTLNPKFGEQTHKKVL